MSLSQTVTLMVVTLRFNATNTMGTVIAQQKLVQKLAVQGLLENQLALMVIFDFPSLIYPEDKCCIKDIVVPSHLPVHVKKALYFTSEVPLATSNAMS